MNLDALSWETFGNLGDGLGGIAALILLGAAFGGGAATLRPWRDKLRAQRVAAEELAKTARLERQRHMQGWSPRGVNTYTIALVTDPPELSLAAEELSTNRRPSRYVVVRVDESECGNENRAHELRQLIDRERHLARPPSLGELELLERARQEQCPGSANDRYRTAAESGYAVLSQPAAAGRARRRRTRLRY